MEILEALCCPVSQEPYGPTGAVRPRILPCGHTISHTSLQSILRQDSSISHACPICRAHLPSDTTRTYPTNFAILDILPGVLRLRNTSSAEPQPYASGDLSSSDSDAGSAALSFHAETPGAPVPTPSTAAVAALFPRAHWLQERIELPLRLAEVLPSAQGDGAALRQRTWERLAAKYELAPAMVSFRGRGRRSSSGGQVAHDSTVCPGHLNGDDTRQALAIHFPVCPLPATDDAAAPTAQHAQQALLAAHAALQLTPEAWRFVQPLLGFFVEEAPTGSPAEVGGAPGGPVGLAFVQQGVTLREYAEQRPRDSLMLPSVEAVEVMRQLTRMLVLLHDQGLTTSATAALTFSSVFIVPGATAAHLSVRWGPWEPAPATSSIVWVADGLCIPPESASADVVEGADPQKADVWRAAAIAVVTLAANWLAGGDRKPTIKDLLTGLQGRIPSHLVIILKGCLHEDPQQRWTAARAQLHLALVATQVQASSNMFDSLWTLPAPWSIMLPFPPGRSSLTGRSSAAGASSRRLALAAEPEAPCGIDVVLDGAALQAARTFEYQDPIAEYVNDMSAAERHYGCIMCTCLVLCLLPLLGLFVVMIIVMNR